MPTDPNLPVLVDPAKTWLSIPNVVSLIVGAAAVGGFLYQSKAVAADVDRMTTQITEKADAKEAKVQAERLAALERLMAVQVQINEQQAKANDLQSKANDKNEAQHEKIIEKLDKALSKR